MKPLAQQTILITGATDGLGKQTALALAREGATLLLHGRNQQQLVTGQYFDQQQQARAHPQAYDMAARRQLRQISKHLTGWSDKEVL